MWWYFATAITTLLKICAPCVRLRAGTFEFVTKRAILMDVTMEPCTRVMFRELAMTSSPSY